MFFFFLFSSSSSSSSPSVKFRGSVLVNCVFTLLIHSYFPSISIYSTAFLAFFASKIRNEGKSFLSFALRVNFISVAFRIPKMTRIHDEHIKRRITKNVKHGKWYHAKYWRNTNHIIQIGNVRIGCSMSFSSFRLNEAEIEKN